MSDGDVADAQGSLACPHCGDEPGSTLACLACGRPLPEADGADHFARLGLPRGVAEAADLEGRFLRLSRVLHPDFHGSADAATRELALRNSALLNEAYEVLTDLPRRAEYLLGLHDPEALERTKALPPAFLMESMELSEAVEEAADEQARAALAEDLRGRVDERLARLGDPAGWADPDVDALAVALHELKVFRRILRDAQAVA